MGGIYKAESDWFCCQLSCEQLPVAPSKGQVGTAKAQSRLVACAQCKAAKSCLLCAQHCFMMMALGTSVFPATAAPQMPLCSPQSQTELCEKNDHMMFAVIQGILEPRGEGLSGHSPCCGSPGGNHMWLPKASLHS